MNDIGPKLLVATSIRRVIHKRWSSLSSARWRQTNVGPLGIIYSVFPSVFTRTGCIGSPPPVEYRQRSRIQMINNNITSQLQTTIDHDVSKSHYRFVCMDREKTSKPDEKDGKNDICAKGPPICRW